MNIHAHVATGPSTVVVQHPKARVPKHGGQLAAWGVTAALVVGIPLSAPVQAAGPAATRGDAATGTRIVDPAVVPAGRAGCRECQTGQCRGERCRVLRHHPHCHNGVCSPHCPIRPDQFGYYGTQWRRWPGSGVVPVSAIEAATPAQPPRLQVPGPDEESPRGSEQAGDGAAEDTTSADAGDAGPSRLPEPGRLPQPREEDAGPGLPPRSTPPTDLPGVQPEPATLQPQVPTDPRAEVPTPANEPPTPPEPALPDRVPVPATEPDDGILDLFKGASAREAGSGVGSSPSTPPSRVMRAARVVPVRPTGQRAADSGVRGR
jgi:hypothetical protein